MDQTKTLKSHITDLIALCHILDKFDEFNFNEFNETLINLISVKDNRDNRDIISKLEKIANDNFVISSRKTKRFYQKNSAVIDLINKYSGISNFIYNNYDWQGNPRADSNLAFFYQYLSQHKDKLKQILALLEKIKNLGFEKIEFDENSDFSDTEYEICTRFNANFTITYLDNIKITPNYQKDIVKYTTTRSNYKMTLEPSGSSFYSGNSEIMVNGLLFDSKRLPETISKESIFDKIIRLKEKQQQHCIMIKSSVDLNISIEDLYNQFNSTSRIIEKLDTVTNKQELHEVLSKIKEYLMRLQIMSTEYDDSIIKEDSPITKEILQKEKQLYLKRREWASLDIDD